MQQIVQKTQPISSYDYIDKIKDMYSLKKKVEAEGPKTDEVGNIEIKETAVVNDKRLEYINLMDSKQFKTDVSMNKTEVTELDMEEDKHKTSKVRGLNQDASAKLPIIYHEREIMENIENNIVTIVCGETGSGKSTQIPQFIYKAAMSQNWKFRGSNEKLMIGITQPRRVAAVSLAKRVSEELNTTLGKEVGYQIRYDSEFFDPATTQVKFMTDGILLKEIETDFLLKHYSVLIIDEAHERSLNSDILISLLTRIAHARCEKAHAERL